MLFSPHEELDHKEVHLSGMPITCIDLMENEDVFVFLFAVNTQPNADQRENVFQRQLQLWLDLAKSKNKTRTTQALGFCRF